MCGLFGWQLPGIDASDRAVLAAGLMLGNTTRGADSWGFWSPDTVPVRGLGELDRGMHAKRLAASVTLVGHTRYATHGNISMRNSHPFIHGHITGAHNGAIFNADTIDAAYPERNFQVDSEHLIAHIAERRPLHELTGYGSVAYTDARVPDTVFLARMADGELSVAKVKGGGVVWSSDDEHLVTALRIAGMRATLCHVKEGALYMVQGGELLKTRERCTVAGRERLPAVKTFATHTPAREIYPSEASKEVNAGWDKRWTRTSRGWKRSAWDDLEEKIAARERRERAEAAQYAEDLEDGFDMLASGEE